jgi:hypothetical protein
MYIQQNATIAKLTLADDAQSINIDMTITYVVEGADKMPPASTGCTINLDLTTGDRSTMVAELNTKTAQWFSDNFNPAP